MTAPHHLGKYEITEVLGQGAMGVVYKGFDPGIRRTVAIKTIRRELVEGERHAAAMLARFRNEAQAAGKLAHPGIVAVYDYGEDASVAYIAMEYVEGNSLREYIGRGTRFAERDAVSIMSQLLEALGHAHERRVWHRDIKPGNVIVMRSGKVKIADFGIARIEASELTQTGVMLGSPGYMAPEQYAASLIDHRADLFAAGVVFYQLVTGAKPFVGTAEQVSYATCHTEPLRASLADPGKGWERYDPVFAKVLAKKPEERFQSADAFRAAILAAHDAPAAAAVSEETIITEVLRPGAAVDLSASPRPKQGAVPRSDAAPAAQARQRRGWAMGALAALLVAGIAAAGWAWHTGWIAPKQPDMEAQLAKARADAEDAQRRAKAAAAAAAEAKRQLESQRLAEAKAKADAESKAKAEAEAKAQSAAETKTRAEAKAKAKRAPSTQATARPEARPSKPPAAATAAAQPAPAEVARAEPEPAASPPPPKPQQRGFFGSVFGTGPTRFDGAWNVTRSCEDPDDSSAQIKTSWSVYVTGGEFVLERGSKGQPGYSLVKGKPGNDGSLALKGTEAPVRRSERPLLVYYNGRLDGGSFALTGRQGSRNCSLVLARP
jgi:tRNA A-37 threonylcarbamoyl transferase component Bud32